LIEMSLSHVERTTRCRLPSPPKANVLFLLEVCNLLVRFVDLQIHLVHFVHQRIEGVVLVVDLGLEAEAEALQSAQAAAHLI